MLPERLGDWAEFHTRRLNAANIAWGKESEYMIGKLVVLACLVSGGVQAAALPTSFEPVEGRYVAGSRGQIVEISPRSLRVAATDANSALSVECAEPAREHCAERKPPAA
jgi:hypothetical protein